MLCTEIALSLLVLRTLTATKPILPTAAPVLTALPRLALLQALRTILTSRTVARAPTSMLMMSLAAPRCGRALRLSRPHVRPFF
jgi:hypothetical protein